ncbi:uncharacterized protein B0T15DRAFT_512843 [Chaetomium strumarium]|uniref:Bromo domain-containing protein n=1 Tax=Chaetomium strumarium TaxID=1170767 RepID=A0AAJ0GRU3_9PEZI|nr:hypothetical protein B0T15DRAFT_512843 [Chaetomium strumarium]
MTSPATPHTPLETLLLFRGIAHFGLDDDSVFSRVSEVLQDNKLIKHGPTFDARRLSADTLRDHFLQLLREELKNETELGSDGALSPASRKCRLQSPPLLTLNDAIQHVEQIESAYAKVHDAYLRHAIEEIRHWEQRYEALLGEIAELEKASPREPDGMPKSESPAIVEDIGRKHEVGPVNGVGPSSGTSPRPPQIPLPPSVPQHPQRTLQPLLPHPASRQDVRNRPSPPQGGAPENAAPVPQAPAPALPQVVRSPQLSQQDASKTPPPRPAATPKPPHSVPQVLQPPQGVPAFPPPSQSPAPPPLPPAGTEGSQCPGAAELPKESPGTPLANTQLPSQGQLKWEPPYQPNAAPPRQATSAASIQHRPTHPYPPRLPSPSQRLPQQPLPIPSPVLGQGQTSRPLAPQQVLIPPHSPSHFTPPLQSPPVRPAADTGSGTGPNRQHPLLPNPAPNTIPRPQSPYHPPPYQGYHVPNPGQPAPVHHVHAGQAHPAPGQVGSGRSLAMPAGSPPLAPTPPWPGQGHAAPPSSPRVQHPNLQAPYTPQCNIPPGVPPAGSIHPDAAQRYSSPYQPPRPAAVERIHPRLPATVTPTPAARFSPVPSAPQTPVMTLPPRVSHGSGTKWLSTSTPSTPRPGIEFRLGHDDVPSPAYEPVSPVLKASAPPPTSAPGGTKDTAEKQEVPGEAKHKPGRLPVPQRVQAGGPTPQPRQPPRSSAMPQAADAQAKVAPQAEVEPRVKDEATTPRPSTETGDTTADESVTGQPQPLRATKRKRDDLTPTPARTPAASHMREASPEGSPSPGGPKLVLWTRSFNKVCGSAMEQIIHHRSANMFAAPIREKDAPGYNKVIKQPQDLKSIRAAINHGNRAAAQAAAALPDGGDPGTSSVWLPRTEDLVPPRSIINSSQLDRELAHMFANAIMYNPDPHHGPGPAFLRRDDGADEEAEGAGHHHHHQDNNNNNNNNSSSSSSLGYKVDEFGVVNDARAMFVEVEKLLSELRSAEVRRNVPPAGAATGTSTRQASVVGGVTAAGSESVRDDGDVAAAAEEEGAAADDEQQQHEDGVGGGGAVKRRRVARGIRHFILPDFVAKLRVGLASSPKSGSLLTDKVVGPSKGETEKWSLSLTSQVSRADGGEGSMDHLNPRWPCSSLPWRKPAMPRSDEAQAFFNAVYRAVQEIPHGKVTTYGHIAKLVGTPQRARQVGICLKQLRSSQDSNNARFNSENVPWQRVINSKGVISPRSEPSGAANQAVALGREGVTVTIGALGERMVDFAEYGWFPRMLPSEEAQGLVPSDEEDEGEDEERA